MESESVFSKKIGILIAKGDPLVPRCQCLNYLIRPMRGRVHHLTYVLMSLALMCTASKPSENLSVRKLGQGRLVA